MNSKTPKKKINYERIKELAGWFCSEEEIADILEIEIDTLKSDGKIQKNYRKSFSTTVSELRKIQLELARKGNPAMLALLGKQYLGQRDKVDVSNKALDYDLSKLPDFFLERIVNGEDPVKVINEYENVSSSKTGRSGN
jgi:hypothetical protein